MMPRTLGMMKRETVVQRARNAIGRATAYRLGIGGRDPFAQMPGAWIDSAISKTRGNGCDCSGFVAWAIGIDRYLPNAMTNGVLPGGFKPISTNLWFETTSVYNDALAPYGYATAIDWMQSRIGDVAVWPDRKGKQGHIGIISRIENAADAGMPTHIIHCSASNWRAGDAIAETSTSVFVRNEAIACQIAWVI